MQIKKFFVDFVGGHSGMGAFAMSLTNDFLPCHYHIGAIQRRRDKRIINMDDGNFLQSWKILSVNETRNDFSF